MAEASRHRWRFYRAGGVDQVRLDRGADLLHLPELDQKLWVALSCPVKGLEFDERTLALLDSDKDGRVRVPEILETVRWLAKVLKDPDTLVQGQDGVALSNINGATPEGKAVLGAAKHMLDGLGRNGAAQITVEDAMKTSDVFAHARLNGDGVVPPDTVQDPEARQVAEEVVATLGGLPDRSGKTGFDGAKVKAFFEACAAYDAWRRQGEAAAEVLPLGEATVDALGALDTVRAKVDDYFVRCRLAAFDPRAQAAVNRSEEAYLEAAAKDLAVTAQEVLQFPLALVEGRKPLPLAAGINPGWQAAVDALRTKVVEPLLGRGKDSLTEAEWTGLQARFAPHRAWWSAKAGAVVEPLGAARVRAILAGGSRARLEQAVADDLAVAPEVDAIGQVERLARCHRDLHRLLNNFVSFTDFYARRKAIFQAGTLFLDGRSTDLCVQVNDAGKHGILAGMSKTYLAYVDCTRPSGEKMTVACAITAGDSDNLFVGRNGLFYDRKGRDRDASISKIVDNPISIGQAFFGPYKKLLRWIEEQVAKRAAAADDAANARLQSAAAATADAAKGGAPAAPKPKFDIGVVAALGVAVGGITAALGALLQAFFGLGIWMPLGLVGIVLLISGPSMLIAYLKLRRRNLGPILDANGWAVNTLTKVNIPLGRSLTDTARLPPGSERSLVDPYAPKKPLWRKLLPWVVLLGLALFGTWKTGYLHDWVPQIPDPETLWFRQRGDPCAPPPSPAEQSTIPPAGAPPAGTGVEPGK